MTFAELVDRLQSRGEMPLFAGEAWDAAITHDLRDATPASLFPHQRIADAPAAAGAIIGLRIWNDEFEAAHNLAQGLTDATGSYWHGICHRREGHRGSGLESNLGNARHWFRRVGQHPAYDDVYRTALNVLGEAGVGFRWATEARQQLEQRGEWDPAILADWVGEAERGVLSPATIELLEQLQWREIALLTDWCAKTALGE